MNGGLGSGGVGICKIGKGIERSLVRGSVTPGMEGIKGGKEICLGLSSASASGTGEAHAK
jgi:hypothetical protein